MDATSYIKTRVFSFFLFFFFIDVPQSMAFLCKQTSEQKTKKSNKQKPKTNKETPAVAAWRKARPTTCVTVTLT